MKVIQWRVKSQVGPLYLIASEKGLRGVFWNKQAIPMAKSLKSSDTAAHILSGAVQELEAYFKGNLKKFRSPLDPAGTPFQKTVWNRLRKIPYGQTRSYRDIARGIQNPKAVRAVGSANGQNPLCIIVPCHRVISADGSLGGYSGGLNIKSRLLKLENRAVKPNSRIR